MPIPLNENDLVNIQQMEVAVCGPDGASHLILCTGIARLQGYGQETYTFPVGPRLIRRQFVAVIASGALSQFQKKRYTAGDHDDQTMLNASLLTIMCDYDDESGRVIVRADVLLGTGLEEASISYQVGILAELPASLRTK